MAWCNGYLLASAVLVGIIQMTNAAATSLVVESSPDDPNKCFRSVDKLILSVGEVKHLPDCSIIACKKFRGQLSFQTESCGPVAPSERCRKVDYTSKIYPGCCPQVECD